MMCDLNVGINSAFYNETADCCNYTLESSHERCEHDEMVVHHRDRFFDD
jgi:hypothetical protein